MNKIISNVIRHDTSNERIAVTKNGKELNLLIKFERLGELLHKDIIPLSCLLSDVGLVNDIDNIDKNSIIDYCKIKLHPVNNIINIKITINGNVKNLDIAYDLVDRWNNDKLSIVPKHNNI